MIQRDREGREILRARNTVTVNRGPTPSDAQTRRPRFEAKFQILTRNTKSQTCRRAPRFVGRHINFKVNLNTTERRRFTTLRDLVLRTRKE